MKFGEKVKQLRMEKGWTQDELARKLGKSKRTVVGYENGETYPRKREVYSVLAELFDVDVNYLLTENEEFISEAGALYGKRGQLQAEELLEQAAALFAGGALSPDDELAFVNEIQQLYLDSKKQARKFTPRKYRKDGEDGDRS